MPFKFKNKIAADTDSIDGIDSTGFQAAGNELSALQSLSDSAGFVKKVSDGVYSIDASTYLGSGAKAADSTKWDGSNKPAFASNGGKFLRLNVGATDFEFAAVTGTGDVVGPASASGNNIVFFDGTTGKLLKDAGVGPHYYLPGIAVYLTTEDPDTTPYSVLLTSHANCPTASLYYVITHWYNDTGNNRMQMAFSYMAAEPTMWIRRKNTTWSAWRNVYTSASTTIPADTLDGQHGSYYQTAGNELAALQALADTAGYLKKTGDGAYAIESASFWRLVSDGTYNGLADSAGGTTGYVRTPASGIIPNVVGGGSAVCGTSGWPFASIYGTTIYQGGVQVCDVGGWTMNAGANIALNATTGTKIGTATTQKLGFFNATPIVRPGAYTQTYATADKTMAAQTSVTITNNTGGIVSTTFASITAGSSYTQADMTAVRNALASTSSALNKLKTDDLDLRMTVNAIIDDLQALGLVG